MAIRPIPSPSVVLPDPGNTPIVTGSYFYKASQYKCTKTECGAYQGNVIIFSGASQLRVGAWYISSRTPGFIYTPLGIADGATSGIPVDTTAQSGCQAACIKSFETYNPPVTPAPSYTPSVTPSITPTVTPSRNPEVSPTPSITPTKSPSATPSITPTPSVTPSITATPSVTPYSSPSVGFYVTCSWQILNTVPTSSDSLFLGNLTGSLPSSTYTSGIFIPSSSYTATNTLTNYSFRYFDHGLSFSTNVPTSPYIPPFSNYLITPPTPVAANNSIVSGYFYISEPDFWSNVRINYSWVQNRAGGVDELRDWSLRIRIYKNGYLIYNYVSAESHNTSYTFVRTFNMDNPIYGTMCAGDDIKIVYSRA
jgi:hypothetical protein